MYPIPLNGSKYVENKLLQKKQENGYVVYKTAKTVLDSVDSRMMILERLTHETEAIFELIFFLTFG